ncbi:MAG: hypothetical protein HQK52_16565 [Oligoflexia bacterium]|nr:hypothetical protein [Oligoflexia bacterium]
MKIFFASNIGLLILAFMWTIVASATIFSERQNARSNVEYCQKNKESCEKTLALCQRSLGMVDKRVKILTDAYAGNQGTIDIFGKIKKYIDTNNVKSSGLKDIISTINTWKKENPVYGNDANISNLLISLADLENCYSDLLQRDNNIVNWMMKVIGVETQDKLKSLLDEACGEVSTEQGKINEQNMIIKNNSEMLAANMAIANSLSVVQVRTDGTRNGYDYCGFYGGWSCVYADVPGKNCSSPLPAGSLVWCLTNTPGPGESISGPVSTKHSSEGRNGHLYCNFWGGENYKCIYTSKGFDCTSSLSDSEYVWCLKVR